MTDRSSSQLEQLGAKRKRDIDLYRGIEEHKILMVILLILGSTRPTTLLTWIECLLPSLIEQWAQLLSEKLSSGWKMTRILM